MLTLFPSSDFPRHVVRLYSCTAESVLTDLVCNTEVQDISCNSRVLCAVLTSGSLEIYSTSNFALLRVMHLKQPGAIGMTVRLTLSSLYIAYTLAGSVDQSASVQSETLTDKLASSLYNFADYGLSTVKSYFDNAGWTGKGAGKITIANLFHKQIICEFNAFATSTSLLKFSPSSHLLVVACESGQNIHVYRINPPTSARRSESGRHLLIYQLTRGMTVAQMSDICFSADESWLCLSTMRGTNHIYKIDPTTTSLHYNHPVFTRVKSGSMLEKQQLAPVCSFPQSDQPELLRVDTRGKLKLWLVKEPPETLGFTMLSRKACFEEMSETRLLTKIRPRPLRDSPEWLGVEMPGNWLPLFKSPQFTFKKSKSTFEEHLQGCREEEDWEEELPSLHFMIYHYDPTQESCPINEALKNPMKTKQIIEEEPDDLI
jgi:hypothetical protein